MTDAKLTVRGLTKQYPLDGRTRTLFRDLSFDLPQDGRLALLGRNGQGKSTLIKIVGGVVPATAGEVKWRMRCSWPLGFGGAFQGAMSGLDNIRFLARVYRRPAKEMIERVDEFAQLGKTLTMPVKYYSSGMRARLAFGLSLAIEFDCYLIDEVISVGDALFRRRCEEELFSKRAHCAFIIASHDLDLLRQTCHKAIVIEDGHAKFFDDMDEAIAVYRAIWEEQQVIAEDPQTAPADAGFTADLLSAESMGLAKISQSEPSAPEPAQPSPEAIARLAAESGLEWWGVETFLSPETADGRCPAVVDVAGPSRVLVFGPYKVLTPGVWRATAFIELCPDAARCRLDVEFGSHPDFSRVAAPFLAPGSHKLEIEHIVTREGPAEVRIVLRRGGVHR